MVVVRETIDGDTIFIQVGSCWPYWRETFHMDFKMI